MKKPADDRDLLLQMTEEAFRLPTWNGTNLRSALRRVSPELGQWLPPGGRRSIADITVHCAYWKYAIRRQLRGDERGSFGIKGSNWFGFVGPLTASQWSDFLKLLDDQHVQLCDAIKTSPLNLRLSSGAQRPIVRKIMGLAIHDAYHTGQVQLLKKLWKRMHGQRAKPTRR